MTDSTSPAPVALVTGAGSGIGRAVARRLLESGFHVVAAGRREAALAELAPGNQACMVQTTDVTDEGAVGELFAALKAKFGRLDLLFNNAGSGTAPSALEDLALDEWQRVLAVNLTGAFLCTQAAFRLMKTQSPRGGRIINNGSVSAHSPRPFSIAYTASKHAITGLTKSSSLEGRAFDIACGQIDIGNAATEMTARMAHGVPQADGSVRAEPTMDVSAVADAVLYMARLPLSANVQFMTVMATTMPFIGRG